MKQEDIDLMALDLMEQHVDDKQLDQQDEEALYQRFDELQEIRTTLKRERKPINVESRLSAFHRAHPAGDPSAQHTHTRRTLRYTLAAALLSTAAIALAALILRPARHEQPPMAKGVVYQSNVKQYVSVAQQDSRAVAFKGTSNNVELQPSNYLLNKQRNKEVKITVPYGNSANIQLPDGSMAYVHTGSEISFYPVYVEGKRIVELKGEAYFKVKHDEAHPFVVVANNVQTTVLGTEFNVNTEAKAGTAVTLISGSVEVKAKHHTKRITPGTQVTATEKGLAATTVDLQPYTNWRDGYFYFDNIDLCDIMQAIGKTYNLTVMFNNEKALRYKTHFVADRTKGIEEVLKTINQMGKIKAHVKDNTIIVD